MLQIYRLSLEVLSMVISHETAVGAVVAERIGRARVFERLGIDYCCHGGTLLGEACARRSLDVEHVLSELAAADRDEAAGDDATDYAAMPAGALADHIEQTHHAYLRQELPRLAGMLDKVAGRHGDDQPWWRELRDTFSGLRQELELHLLKEEQVLFPLVKRLEAASQKFPIHCGSVANPIRVMEHEHDDAGEVLAKIRALTEAHPLPADACNTRRALYDGLAALEADLHRHIHKENNILFPRASELEAALG
jgi:regulator of cell morphogenesis and NO signaling